MSGKEYKNEDENLNAFEAALRSLRPRADRLDPRWRSLLAEEARRSCFSMTTTGDESSLPVDYDDEDVMLKHNLQGCKRSGGHRFVCIRCGRDAPTNRGLRRWTWPAAFSTMTAVAAVLLAMLVIRTEPRIAGTAIPSLPSGNEIENGRPAESWLAGTNLSRRPPVFGTDEMSYLTLRDQVLRDGVESWKSPASAVVVTRTTESPLTYREQLDRLLKQQDLRGS
jgi:hypothetical protein